MIPKKRWVVYRIHRFGRTRTVKTFRFKRNAEKYVQNHNYKETNDHMVYLKEIK